MGFIAQYCTCNNTPTIIIALQTLPTICETDYNLRQSSDAYSAVQVPRPSIVTTLRLLVGHLYRYRNTRKIFKLN